MENLHLSTREKDAEDRLFLVDGSSSMNERIGQHRAKKIEIVKAGLKQFCLERWSTSYYPWPLRIGVVVYRLLGTPGGAVFEVVIPLYPEPPSLELYRVDGLKAKGGSPLLDALRYALVLMAESVRKVRRVKIIGDGGNDGPSPMPVVEEIGRAGIVLDCIEFSDSPSPIMGHMAERAGGKYYAVNSLEEFLVALGQAD